MPLSPRPVVLTTLDVPGLIRQIRALAEQHGGEDTYAEGLAIDAFQAGRPVFWTRAGYSNQAAGILLDKTHQLGLAVALTAYPRGAEYIETLIPLTPSAEAALEEARWQIAGARMAAE